MWNPESQRRRPPSPSCPKAQNALEAEQTGRHFEQARVKGSFHKERNPLGKALQKRTKLTLLSTLVVSFGVSLPVGGSCVLHSFLPQASACMSAAHTKAVARATGQSLALPTGKQLGNSTALMWANLVLLSQSLFLIYIKGTIIPTCQGLC